MEDEAICMYIKHCFVTKFNTLILRFFQSIDELVEPFLAAWSLLENASTMEEADELRNKKLDVVKNLLRIYDYYCMPEECQKWQSEYQDIAGMQGTSKVKKNTN